MAEVVSFASTVWSRAVTAFAEEIAEAAMDVGGCSASS